MVKKAAATKGSEDAPKSSSIPPYGRRQGWVPKSQEDFGDGGAYPEIHVPQFPLGMEGRKSGKTKSNQMALSISAEGQIAFESVLGGQGSRARDAIPLAQREGKLEFEAPGEEEEDKAESRTKKALQRILEEKTRSLPGVGDQDKKDANGQFVRYTPTTGETAGMTRVVQIVQRQVDPLEPAKHSLKKREPEKPATGTMSTVLHSPTRKPTKEELDEWKLPPAISNYVNPRGYTIPLDKRLAADGRGLQDNSINNKFAHFAEALYLAGEHAREEVARRAEMRKEALLAEQEAEENRVQEMARQTLEAKQRIVTELIVNKEKGRRGGGDDDSDSDSDLGSDEDDLEKVREREKIREERRYERERQRRMESAGGKRRRDDDDRDVSERIALGQRVPLSKDTMFDQRLFNRSEGMQTNFGNDEEYSIYDKPLFTQGSEASLYRPKANDDEGYVSQAEIDKLRDTSRFKPDRDFSGVDRSGPRTSRNEPVQFEKGVTLGAPPTADDSSKKSKKASDADDGGDLLAGLDDFLAAAKKR